MDRDSQKKRSCCRELRDVESCSSAEFREASNWFGGRNNGKYRLVLRMHGEQNMLTKLARIAKLWCETLRRRIILQQGLRNSLDCAPPLCATLFARFRNSAAPHEISPQLHPTPMELQSGHQCPPR